MAEANYRFDFFYSGALLRAGPAEILNCEKLKFATGIFYHIK